MDEYILVSWIIVLGSGVMFMVEHTTGERSWCPWVIICIAIIMFGVRWFGL